MTVISKDIPQTEKLLKLIPENVYTKDTPWLARQVVKINSDNQSGVSTTFPATNILRFTVNPTDTNLLCLSETYLSFAGRLNFYTDANVILKNTINDASILIIPPYWWINSIQQISLYIGGVIVYNINNPMQLVNYYVSHYKSFTDRQNGNLEEKGIYPIPSFVEAGTNNHYDTKYVLSSFTDAAKTAYYNSYPYNIQVYSSGSAANPDYGTFQQIVYLSDIFPGIDTIKPIFGQSVILEIKMESDGFTGIRGSEVSTLSYAKIENFRQFNLNLVSYQLDSPMVEKLKQVYSKEIISIIDDISYFTNSLNNISSDSQFNLSLPLNLAFSSDNINISFPEATANNFSFYTDWDAQYLYLNHTKFDNRLYPVKNISVYADGVLLYSRDYATSTVDINPQGGVSLETDNPFLKSLGNAPGFNLYDYTILYKEYKESRYATYENEHNAIPIDEWLNSYFSINIPTSAFTKLSTKANIILQINFGSGINNNTQYSITRLNTSATDGEFIQQIKVIQKSKKALVFKGWNTCEVRTIEQSFSNDITIDNLNDTQKTN